MHKNFKTGLILVVALLALPAAAMAATLDLGTVSVGPRLTFAVDDDADEGQVFVGAQARFHLNQTIALETSLDYSRKTYDWYWGDTDVTMFPLQVALVGYFLPDSAPVRPYVLGGVGWYYTRIDGPLDNDTDSRLGIHAGLGCEFKLDNRMAIDMAYRYVAREDIESRDLTWIEKDYDDDGSMLSVGFMFKF